MKLGPTDTPFIPEMTSLATFARRHIAFEFCSKGIFKERLYNSARPIGEMLTILENLYFMRFHLAIAYYQRFQLINLENEGELWNTSKL